MRRPLVLPLLTALGLVTAPTLAVPCSCLPSQSVYDEWNAVDAVFAGEVTSIESAEPDHPASSWVTFRVDRHWKGELSEETRILNSVSSASCGADLQVGTRYLVYAFHVAQTQDLATGLCTRTHATWAGDPDVAILDRGWPFDGGPPFGLTATPNPGRGPIRLSWSIPIPGDPKPARIEVVDFQGRRVRTLVAESAAVGSHLTWWDGRDDEGRPTPAGIYFVWLHAGGRAISRKLVKVTTSR